MKKCAFTIVAKNYIGLALILKESIEKYNNDLDFYICVADEMDKEEMLPPNTIITRHCLNIEDDLWREMSFKYNLTEFCTAIKPSCFKYLFGKSNYESIIYFDPDIFIFSSLDEIYSMLELHPVVLTPQSAEIHINYVGEHPESSVMLNGIFNLGFCGIAKTTISMLILDWWEERLKDKCFVDNPKGYFTDQKWMDWMPALLSEGILWVSGHLGMNAAPWNYFEREFFDIDGIYYVRPRISDNGSKKYKLLFVHFAGYDYKGLLNNKVMRKRIENLSNYSDVQLLLTIYKNAILNNSERFLFYINMTYSYDRYDNGDYVEGFHRRLFHGFLEKGFKFETPFACGKTTIHYMLKKKKMFDDRRFADVFNKGTLPNMETRLRQINLLFRILYLLLGYKKYTLFLKALRKYVRVEQHVFLLNPKI